MFADAQNEMRRGTQTAANGAFPPYNPNRTFGRGGGPADFPPSSSTSPHRPGVYQEYKMSKNTAKSGEIQRQSRTAEKELKTPEPKESKRSYQRMKMDDVEENKAMVKLCIKNDDCKGFRIGKP